jgi:hypothetical protein
MPSFLAAVTAALLASFCPLQAQTHPGKTPVRLDLHLAAGLARSWAYPDRLFSHTVLIDLDARVLADRSQVIRRIPRRYRGMVGDELYVGHLLVPSSLAFSTAPSGDAWDFYVDWAPLSLRLFERPVRQTNRAPVSLKTGLQALLAYHYLHTDGNGFHSPRPGLGLRADFKVELCPWLALKTTAFQKVFWPDYREIDGRKRNVMPHLAGVVAGIVVQIPMKVQL